MALTTIILARVPFGNRMMRSEMGIYMPDMQLSVGVLRAIVMLGPCVFAISYPPRTMDPSI